MNRVVAARIIRLRNPRTSALQAITCKPYATLSMSKRKATNVKLEEQDAVSDSKPGKTSSGSSERRERFETKFG